MFSCVFSFFHELVSHEFEYPIYKALHVRIFSAAQLFNQVINEGSKTLTGPAASGFEDLSKLKQAKVKLTYKVREDDNNYFVDITLRNTSGQIAFFNQLQFLNSKMSPIRPSFYTDNFFSLMPGEKKTVTIETAKGKLKDGAVLALKGWNINKQEYKLK